MSDTFPFYLDLPEDLRQHGIRPLCVPSARVLLALTCKRELACLPPPEWSMDESGVNPKHIELVQEQVKWCSRGGCVAALRLAHGDVVTAIMELAMGDNINILFPPKPHPPHARSQGRPLAPGAAQSRVLLGTGTQPVQGTSLCLRKSVQTRALGYRELVAWHM